MGTFKIGGTFQKKCSANLLKLQSLFEVEKNPTSNFKIGHFLENKNQNFKSGGILAPIPAKKYVREISGQTFQKSFKWKKIHLQFLNQEKKGKKKKKRHNPDFRRESEVKGK